MATYCKYYRTASPADTGKAAVVYFERQWPVRLTCTLASTQYTHFQRRHRFLMAPSSDHIKRCAVSPALKNLFPRLLRYRTGACIAHAANTRRYGARSANRFGKPLFQRQVARVQSVSRARPAAMLCSAPTTLGPPGGGRLGSQTAENRIALAISSCTLCHYRLQSASSSRWLAQTASAQALANQSLNRTRCSRPLKARHFILDL